MSFRIPDIGDWYVDRQLKQPFEVVAIDDQAGTIEIQYLDGELSEVDVESWRQMPVSTSVPPEDWTAPYEISPEDNPFDDIARDYDLMENPVALLESELFEGSEEYY